MAHTIGVYGLGRFGIFWASLLATVGNVKVCSRTKKDSLPDNLTWAEESEVLGADAVFFCVSISSFEEVLKKTASLITPQSIVFDTCSVKVHPAKLMQQYLHPDVEIIATHPMFGPDSAKNGVKDLPMVFSPVRASKKTISLWHGIFSDMGLSMIDMTPHDHDKEAAFTQGITHYMGRVLADLSLKPSPIATLGYRKLLEIVEQTCNDPWQLFLDIQNFNPYTRDMRIRLHKSLEKIYGILDNPENQ
ncbi:MAG: prephenate dehydrogenase/arogenate dehydrogenase family protein [Spirochaetales bacterium]|nr:prephenate dehydrogenase/arogenate dehydrogenase family protein [Spirochaetales bacterium]